MVFFGKAFLPKNTILFLFLSASTVFGRGLAGNPFEYPCKIIRVAVSAGGAHLPDIEPGGLEQLLRPGDPVLVEVDGEIDPEATAKQSHEELGDK